MIGIHRDYEYSDGKERKKWIKQEHGRHAVSEPTVLVAALQASALELKDFAIW